MCVTRSLALVFSSICVIDGTFARTDVAVVGIVVIAQNGACSMLGCFIAASATFRHCRYGHGYGRRRRLMRGMSNRLFLQ